jgi:flagellar protein FlbB
VKEKIILIGSFVLAFIFVTSAIIYLNTIFTNIFKYDFSPVGQKTVAINQQPAQQNQLAKPVEQKIDSTKVIPAVGDSLKKNDQAAIKDTASMIASKDTNSVAKAIKNVNDQKKIKEAITVKPEKENPVISQVLKTIARSDTSYNKWIKTTGKIYESMDSKKAAKIIQSYSDNIARDLLLSMRKKKAAEIVAEFRPEIAARIISIN